MAEKQTKTVSINGTEYTEDQLTDQQKVTHVYCPTCFKKTMNMINRLGGIGRINQPAQTEPLAPVRSGHVRKPSRRHPTGTPLG